ncbi:MAG TPA: polysaccharide export protein, partial [Gammaproteobacteria bacterium]|nr:polysaccharide export protein [Gammaproteobacteria bacterium]
MKFKTMLNRLLAVFVAILIALPATSLTAAPTDEQIRQFMNLSPAQQAAAKASYLGSNAGSGGGAQPLDTPENVLPIVNQSTSQIEQAAKESTDQVTLAEKKEEKAIKGQLRQFGYDLFAGQATTFAPVSDIPVPSEYVIGPGDTLQIFLFGKENIEHQLQVSREGELNFPGIGPIQVAGMRFDELKSSLNQRIAQQMIGVRASITLGRLRSIRVFILGDVQRPGSYTVSALSTMTNALFVSGGVTKIGSLRNIQLKRQGKVVTTLDLYDLLLKGDTSQDARIQPGDVLFVPPVGEVVGIGGEVRRPALYELEG